MNDRCFNGEISRLRAPERMARLEVKRVVALCLQAGDIQSVLDVGTGSGIFAEAFQQQGLAVAGVDVNPEMVAAAKAYIPQGDFRTAPAEALPFPAQSYDLLFLGLVFHETDDALKAMQEAYRVCRRRTAILEWPYQVQEFGPPLEHRLLPATIRHLAEQAGFRPSEPIQLANLTLYLFER